MASGISEKNQSQSLRHIIGEMEAGSFLYYMSFFLYAFGVLLLTTNAIQTGYFFIARFALSLKLVAFLLLVLKMALFQRQDTLRWAIIVASSLLALASYGVTHDATVLAFVLFISAAKGVDFHILAWLALATNLIVLSVAVIGFLTGSLYDFVGTRDGVIGIRHSMGFSHPNYFGLSIASACTAFFVLRDKRIGLVDVLVGTVCSYFILSVSDSRTAALGILLAYALFFTNAHIKGDLQRRTFCIALAAITFLAVGVSLYLMVNYDPSKEFDRLLNSFLNGRPYWAHVFYASNPPGLLGQNIDLLPLSSFDGGVTTGTLLVDNAYARLYLRYGPIILLVTLLGLVAFFRKSTKSGIYGVVLTGIAFAAIYGLSERMFFQPEFNYFMVIGFSWLFYGFPDSQVAALPKEAVSGKYNPADYHAEGVTAIHPADRHV